MNSTVASLKVTVVTINFNNDDGLRRTINNYLMQDYENKELVIIDGHSKDNSKKIIEEHHSNIDFSISEKDKGIYDAMNKGVKYSTGDWIIFMNSGDEFADINVLKNINFCTEAEIIYGKNKNRKKVVEPRNIGSLKNGEIFACHQSMLFKKSLFFEGFNYDDTLQINGDFELCCNFFKNKKRFHYQDLIISKTEGNGVSQKRSFIKRKEWILISLKYFGLINLMCLLLKKFWKRINQT